MSATKCPSCHRLSWRRSDALGGGLDPNDEHLCMREGDKTCRIAARGYEIGKEEILAMLSAVPVKVPK